jgi:hypothetical protein
MYVPSQGQLQTLRSVATGNYSTDKHNIKSKTNYRQALKKKYVNNNSNNNNNNNIPELK